MDLWADYKNSIFNTYNKPFDNNEKSTTYPDVSSTGFLNKGPFSLLYDTPVRDSKTPVSIDKTLSNKLTVVKTQSTEDLKDIKGISSIFSIVNKSASFADNEKGAYDHCYKFSENYKKDMATTDDCTSNVMDHIGTMMRKGPFSLMNKGIGYINNKIDSVKKFGNEQISDLKNNSVMKSIERVYCTEVGPMMEILRQIIYQISKIPETLESALNHYLLKILTIFDKYFSKLIACADGWANGFIDSLGVLKIPEIDSIEQCFSFFDDLIEFLTNCEVISGPIVKTFNGMLSTCNGSNFGTFFELLGYGPSSGKEFKSAQDVIDFLEKSRASMDASVSLNFAQHIADSINPFLKNNYAKIRSAMQFAKLGILSKLADFLTWLIRPVHWITSAINWSLTSRSRILGIAVNYTLGVFFPWKASSKFKDNKIYRSRYSLMDLMNILDGMSSCSTYICKDFSNMVAQMLQNLSCNKYGKYICPLVKCNDNLNTYLNELYGKLFGEPSITMNSKIAANNVSADFIMNLQQFSSGLSVMTNGKIDE